MAISAHQIWHTLQVTHEGTNKVKKSKVSFLVHKFELFKMKENETIFERFQSMSMRIDEMYDAQHTYFGQFSSPPPPGSN